MERPVEMGPVPREVRGEVVGGGGKRKATTTFSRVSCMVVGDSQAKRNGDDSDVHVDCGLAKLQSWPAAVRLRCVFGCIVLPATPSSDVSTDF